MTAGDIDGDGDQDVLSASWYGDKTAWYRNASGDSPGDLDGDDQFTADDIDLLSRAIRGDDSPGPMHDLNGDSVLNSDDHTYMITTIIGTGLGDTNLDYLVDVSDLNLWKANRFTSDHTDVGNGCVTTIIRTANRLIISLNQN